MNCCKIKDKTHATQMFKTLTNTLHGDVLYEVFTILFCFILLICIIETQGQHKSYQEANQISMSPHNLISVSKS
jgi:hypothetical protein